LEFIDGLLFLTGVGILGVIGMLTAFPCPEKSCGHDVTKPNIGTGDGAGSEKRLLIFLSLSPSLHGTATPVLPTGFLHDK
jgi:hypothetical protein